MTETEPRANASGAGEWGPSLTVDVDAAPWKPTGFPGIEMKVLFDQGEDGMRTLLMRWAPGSELPYHEHTEIEQTYVFEGSLVDSDGEVTAGNYVCRQKGSRHSVRAPEGALVLAVFIRPNRFL
ncbi:MAG: cupin domain-containing protein [Rhodospirillales bacterium]|jgi:anti-sigma factor ChrR (cupin superfamily)|nr:cupin domain-containing protein [Rhodospirillales bacterium]MDP6804849.1 cupin domain-containing protein [Rhodospirillales bacterium]